MPIRLALLAFPLLEIAVFIFVGRWIGVLPVLGLVLCAALAGALILRMAGLAHIGGVHTANAKDIIAAMLPVANRVLIVLAGMLLILPGLVSDAIALALLVPPVRRGVITLLASRFRTDGVARRDWPQDPAKGAVIDADYVDLDAAARPQSDRTPH